MKEKITIWNWIQKFMMSEFDDPSVKTQIAAGWYDWFCKDSSLANKTKRMGRIIKRIKGGKVKLNNWYIWFKNNCPLNGPLYDDFRFADIETGDVMFTVQLDCCWNNHKYAVYGRTPDGNFHSEKPLFETDEVNELVKWFNTPWDE